MRVLTNFENLLNNGITTGEAISFRLLAIIKNLKDMNIESIGTWAGEVYKALESTDTRMLGLKGVKKATKLKKDEIMAALGWLGREGKIALTMNDEDLVITLI